MDQGVGAKIMKTEVLQQQFDQGEYAQLGLVNAAVNESPVWGMGRFIEKPINPDMPWSSFGQVMFLKEHVLPDGKVVKKVAAVSMAYPGGVGVRMAGEALGSTIGIDPSEFARWGGVKEGSIIAATKEVPDVRDQLSLMDTFIDNSGEVIAKRHAQVDHEVVQHFFGLQQARRDFLHVVKQDAMRILENPEFTGRSALDQRYEGKGIYLIEGIIEDGIWDGGDPSGKRMHLVDMAYDDPHRWWLQWAEDKANGMRGDGIIVDAEDTETVSSCGGTEDGTKSKGCSAFFEKMEGGVIFDHNGIKVSDYAAAAGITGAIASSEKQHMCDKCGEKSTSGHSCKEDKQAA